MNWIIDATEFSTRGNCGVGWTLPITITYIISNIVIAMSYWWIPICGLYYWRDRRNGLVKNIKMLKLFILFIFLCGTTHLLDVIVFFWAPYRLYTTVLFMTAVVSAFTAFYMKSFVSQALRLPSRQQLHDVTDQLQSEIAIRKIAEMDLTARNIQLTRDKEKMLTIINTEMWMHDKGRVLLELETILRGMKTQ